MRRRALILAITALLAGPAQADPPPGFIEIQPTEGGGRVALAVSQVVRVGRAEGHTVIDTTAWVQQRTVESVESIARRLTDAGQRLIPLTDLSNGRIYLAADRIVLVRDSGDRHAATARAAIVMVGLRFNTDVAVRESVEDVLAALGR